VKSAAAIFPGAPANALLLNLGDTLDIRWNVNKFEPVSGLSDRPVSVTWYGALAFAMYYGYDLPTTAEWEKGARGPNNDDEGEHLIYPWGNAINSGYANHNGSYFAGNGYTGRNKSPVGYYNGNQTPFGPNNANGYGLYDVIGNVAEWTRTLDSTIETYSQQESLTASHNLLVNSNRLLRGGSYSSSVSNSSVAARVLGSPASYIENYGFRVIRRAAP
jgi:formylglycine-generating enzyme required for sulfatase activity